MKIIIAKTAGFCMGVRRAVEMALDAPTKYCHPIYTYGPLIHNPQVIELLQKKGIFLLHEIPLQGSGTVLIRAHGVPPEIKERLKKAGFNVLDATCQRVIRIQSIISKYAQKEYASIIIGNREHPEVIGLLGYAMDKGYVARTIEELEALPRFEQAIIVAQSTQNTHLFEDVKQWIANKHPHYKIFETICDSTERRQAEVMRLAESVDVILVVGGKTSANTQRLLEIAEKTGKIAFKIETESDLDRLDPEMLLSASSIGISAGASTPNWVIKKVSRALEELPYKHKHGWRTPLFIVQRFLLFTNIYVALAAGFLSYACIKLMDMNHYLPFVLITILYVHSMHTLNHLTGGQADFYNDPERAAFYQKYKLSLSYLAACSGGAGLLIAYYIGVWPFTILLAMSIMGLSYNLRLVPEKFSWLPYKKIKDVPGSKTFLIAFAWGVLATILPALAANSNVIWFNGFVFTWATSLVFVRTVFFDILDIQEDRMVGKESVTILLGEKRSLWLLFMLLAILIPILPLGILLKAITPLGFVLTLCPIYILVILCGYKSRYLLPGIRLKFLMDTQFVMAGLFSFFLKSRFYLPLS